MSRAGPHDSAPPTASKGQWSYRHTARTAASIEELWPLVGEAQRWQSWSFLTSTSIERPGRPNPDGVGAIRRFTSHGISSSEEVLLWEPPTHLGYTILKGFPIRNYRADIELAPDGLGTRIVWSGTFDPKLPGTGRLIQTVLRRVMGRFVRDLVRCADRLAGG